MTGENRVTRFRLRMNGSWAMAFALILASIYGCPDFTSAQDKSTIDLIVPSSPGGGRDLYSRLLARYMPKYLPAKTTILVKNMPGAGGNIALNHVYGRAKKDGSTFGHGTTAMYRNPYLDVPGLRYKLDKFQYIGVLPENPYLLVVRADHPAKTFQDLFKLKKPAFFGIQQGGTGDTMELIGHLLKATGANLKLVSGYRGSSSRRAALLRGELDATLDRFGIAQSYLDEGKMRVLMILTYADHVPEKYRENASIWSKLDLAPQLRALDDFIVTPTDLDKVFLLPPGVPKERVRILRRAFDQAFKDPDLQAKLADVKAVGPAISGEEMQNKIIPRVLGLEKSSLEIVRKWLKK